uniref:SJCHGC04842 protein n=1 Tax=Schistosoma japonicum TaxID=6182 RepID=Q5DAM3_SCHJA|nr:SJCHGC04842 protein [Schistosoma japonicum]
MSCDISPIFASLVSSIKPTTPKLSTLEEGKKKVTDKLSTKLSSSTGYEFSFQTRAESLHSSLKVLSNYLKRIHQLTAGTLGNSTKQRLHAELTENVTVLIEQCTLLLAQLKDLIHTPVTNSTEDTSRVDKRTKSINNDDDDVTNSKNQLVSHRLTIHKLLSEELDSLKKLRESEIKRQQRLVEFSGNLANGVRAVSASGTNVLLI